MRIRNMQEYRAFVSESEENNFEIASKNDKFLVKIKGSPRSSIEKYVENIASFATNIHVQSIYELIQNAGDAEASAMYIFYNEDNFLLLNTGKCFLTQGIEQEVKGEFFDFLRKGEGVHDKGDMGKYGQGSKLLYALIPFLNDDKIENALVERKEGLIVYSWSELTGSLTELLNWDIEKENIQLENYQGNQNNLGKLKNLDNLYPLFTKILYTYFPVHPFEKGICSGENELSELFSKQEVTRFISFLKKSYDLIENKLELSQGTIMYLPLGKGHAEKFDSIRSKVEKSIGTTLHFVNPLKKVTISNTVITNTLEKSQNFYKINVNSSQLLIPKYFEKEHEVLPNFYKFLPVTDEVHNFRFHINNKDFDITADRQHFKDGVEGNLLTRIAEDLSTYIKDIKETNPENINLFISILCSEPKTSKSDKNDYFNKTFYTQYLLEALKTNIPTLENNFLPNDKVGINYTGLKVNPSKLGIDIEWINEKLEEYDYELETKLSVERWEITDLLQNANLEKLQTWISKLSKEDYTNFLEKVSKNYSTEIKSIEFLKGSDGNFYSIAEFENKDILILTDNLRPLENSFQKCNILPFVHFLGYEEKLFGQDIKKYEINLFDKLIGLFNEGKEKLSHAEKYAIITIFTDLYKEKVKEIRTQLHIFQNQSKEYKPLNQLLSDARLYAKSDWLVDLQLLASEKNPLLDQYLMKENEIWEYVCEKLPFQTKITSPYVVPFYEQLEKIHSLKATSKAILDGKAFIFVDTSFKPLDEVFWNEDLKDFSKTDFTVFKSFVERNTNLFVPAQEHIEAINRGFFDLGNDTSEVIKDRINEGIVKIKVTEQEIKVLHQFDKKLLDEFVLFKEEKTFYLQEKIKNKDIQFFVNAENKEIIDYLVDKKENYFLLPAEFINLFPNITLPINSLVSKFGAELEFRCAFINEVIHLNTNDTQNAVTKIDFIKKVDRLDIDSEKEYSSNSYEYKLLEFTYYLGSEEKKHLRSRTYIDEKLYSYYQYIEEIEFVDTNSMIETAKFRLSDILVEFKGISNIVERIKSIFQGIEWMQNNFFEALQMSNNEVFGKLVIQKIDSYDQMAFAIVHIQTIKNYTTKINSFFTEAFTPQSEQVLKVCYKYKIPNFQEVYPILNYPHYSYMFSQKEIDENLVLIKEIIPPWVKDWIREDKEQEKEKYEYLLLLNFHRSVDEVIKFRKNINERDNKLPNTLEVNKVFIENTFEWIYSKINNEVLLSKDNLYKNISQLMNAHIEKHKTLPPYLWQVVFLDDTITKYKLAKENKSEYFSNVKKEKYKELLWKGCQKEKFDFFDFSSFSSAQESYKKELSVGEEFDTSDNNVNQEWEYESYRVWKKTEPIPTYTIYNPQEKVPYKYFLTQGKGIYIADIEKINDKDEAFDKSKKSIYITKKIAIEPKAILEILEKKSSNDQWFENSKDKNELMKLIILSFSNPNDLLSEITNMGTGRGTSTNISTQNSVDLGRKLTDNEVNILKELLKKYDEKEIEKLEKAEIEDTIEENTTHAYRQIIGYVGEQIILQGLQKENKYKELVQVSTKDDNAGYDIQGKETDGKEMYIEVKTTVGTIKEKSNSVALKLGVTQYKFIMNQKTENYHLVRVSLDDMNLGYIAREFKEAEFNEDLKSKINENVKAALENNPNLLEYYDKSAILFFRLSYSKLAELS